MGRLDGQKRLRLNGVASIDPGDPLLAEYPRAQCIVLKNDVTFRMNISISDNKTIQRKVDDIGTVTNGNINFQLRPNISYVVNQKLTVQGYFERTVNEPLVTNSFPRSTTRFGIQVRFSLAQ